MDIASVALPFSVLAGPGGFDDADLARPARNPHTFNACVALALMLVCTPQISGAQDAGDDPRLDKIREALAQHVRITDLSGVQHAGVLDAVDDRTLTLITRGGTVELPLASAQRVEKKGDRVTDGALKGIAVAWLMLLISRSGGQASMLGAGLVYSAYFGVLGAGLDAMHTGWTTVCR